MFLTTFISFSLCPTNENNIDVISMFHRNETTLKLKQKQELRSRFDLTWTMF